MPIRKVNLIKVNMIAPSERVDTRKRHSTMRSRTPFRRRTQYQLNSQHRQPPTGQRPEGCFLFRHARAMWRARRIKLVPRNARSTVAPIGHDGTCNGPYANRTPQSWLPSYVCISRTAPSLQKRYITTNYACATGCASQERK
jgi:hypothetical protein